VRHAHVLFGVGVALLAFTAQRHARAYCLTTTCDPRDPAQHCEEDSAAHGCIMSGIPLHWASACVSFDVQKDGSERFAISYDTTDQVVQNAFLAWLNADCGGGLHPKITPTDLGAVNCDQPEYNQKQSNANVVMFRDHDWPYQNTIDTLALTTVTFNVENGEIYDADIEVNSFESDFSTNGLELSGVLTHEIGHFLGLSHENKIPTATMRPTYQRGLAVLDPDDEAGICKSLPPDRTVLGDSCTPRHGFSSDCAAPTSTAGCCSTAVGASASRAQGLGALLFLASFGLWRTRRGRRRTSRSTSR
jgi:Matrixin